MSENKFHADSTALEVIEGHDLTGYNIIVTGANSGIGVETVRALAKVGATVIMCARNVEKAEAVRDELRQSTSNQNIHLEQLELDSLENVNAFVQRILEKKMPLHILINNAGIMACPLSRTKDGFESQFGTNHLGHFALTIGLLPALRAGVSQSKRNARIVNLSSCAHGMSDFDFEDPNYHTKEYDAWKAYGKSKTANILFSVALNEKFQNEGIFSYAVHPGIIATNLGRHAQEQFEYYQSIFKTKTIPAGASTTVWAAVAKELDGKGGLYLEDCSISKETTQEKLMETMSGYAPYIYDKENAKKFWDLSEKLVKKN